MTRVFLLPLLLWLISPFASPGAQAAELSLGLYVLGVPVADASLSLDLTASGYRVGLRHHTIGLADLVAGSSLDAHARGAFDGGKPAPQDYLANSMVGGQDRSVGLTWREASPIVTRLVPPNTGDREEVPDALRARTIDPLSSIVQLIHEVAVTGRCDVTSHSYDGRRLQLFEARTAGEEDLETSRHSSFAGRALRCDFTDRMLAGYRLGAGRDDDKRTRRGIVWLARLVPGGPLLPVRASIETLWLGDAMIYLKSITP